jgi:type VI protein secretion system component Hcp
MGAFLHLDGIEGGSRSEDHRGAVDVLSWTWGVTTQTGNGGGGAGGMGRPRAHEFRFVHHYDLASPHLSSLAATGRHVLDATLSVVRPGSRDDLLTVTMRELVVTEVLVSGTEEDADEEVALQPAWIRFDHTEPDPAGGAGGRTSTFTWDIRSNKVG